jgi:Restriction endonuclease
MMTPMVAQYLVGLCCLRRNPDAVDVTIGDRVPDSAAGTERDVDVTVTLTETDGSVRAFKAYEVKQEKDRVNVATVEQLAAKLADMPSITHRAIVTSRDFTQPAIRKAESKGVELFVLKPWTRPLGEQFPSFQRVGTPDSFAHFLSGILYWNKERVHLTVPDGPPVFSGQESTPLYGPDGLSLHPRYPTFKEFRKELLLRSTVHLSNLDSVRTVLDTMPQEGQGVSDVINGPECPYTHAVDTTEAGVFLTFAGGAAQITKATISGNLQWRQRRLPPEFRVMERVGTEEVFAAAAIAELDSARGMLGALVFAPDSRTVGVHYIELSEKQKNMINRLKVRGSQESTVARRLKRQQ